MLIWVPIDRVVDSPYQVRRRLSDTHLLANDIADIGLLHPPTGRVVWLEDGPEGDERQVEFAEFLLRSSPRVGGDLGSAETLAWWSQTSPHVRVELTGGHRRMAAIRALIDDGRWFAEIKRQGIAGAEPDSELVPMDVRGLVPEMAARAVVTENLARVDLSPLERLHAFQALRDSGYKVQAIADLVGVTRSTMATSLGVLELPDWVLALVDQGKLAPGVARYLRQFRCGDTWGEDLLVYATSPFNDAPLSRARVASAIDTYLRYPQVRRDTRLPWRLVEVVDHAAVFDKKAAFCVHTLSLPSFESGRVFTCEGERYEEVIVERVRRDREKRQRELEERLGPPPADEVYDAARDAAVSRSKRLREVETRASAAVADRMKGLMAVEPWLREVLWGMSQGEVEDLDFDEVAVDFDEVAVDFAQGAVNIFGEEEEGVWQAWLEKYAAEPAGVDRANVGDS